MQGVIRLRQVVIAARDLDAVVDQLCSQLDLRVCFNDPGVAEFGLRNALMTVGDQFIEVVSPIQDDTAAGRLLDRRKADVTSYMVMFEVDNLDDRLAALATSGVRVVWSGDLPSIRGRHLHPADVGGAIVSIDQCDPVGSWHWGGPNWRPHMNNAVVTSIAGYAIAVDDPTSVSQRWEALGLKHGVRFITPQTGSEIELVATDRNSLGTRLHLDQVLVRLV
jgi:hypothetical protein